MRAVEQGVGVEAQHELGAVQVVAAIAAALQPHPHVIENLGLVEDDRGPEPLVAHAFDLGEHEVVVGRGHHEAHVVQPAGCGEAVLHAVEGA